MKVSLEQAIYFAIHQWAQVQEPPIEADAFEVPAPAKGSNTVRWKVLPNGRLYFEFLKVPE